MKGRKEIAILFFIIAVLVFYIFSGKSDKTHYKLPVIEKLNTNEVSMISLKKGDTEIIVIKEDDKWFAGQNKYPADASVVKKMLEQISGLKLTALASESKSYAIYELDEKKRIEVAVYRGDTLLRKVVIGKTASSYSHTFVLIDEDYRVYHAQGNFRSDFDKDVSDLRDKKVMAFTDDIIELKIKEGEEELTVIKATAPVSVDITDRTEEEQKAEETGPKWITAGGKAVKEEEIEEIINTLSAFRCDNFIEKKTKEDFTSPIYTVTLQGATTYSISFFEKKDDRYPAVSSESEYPFLVSEWKGDKVMKSPGNLLKEIN